MTKIKEKKVHSTFTMDKDTLEKLEELSGNLSLKKSTIVNLIIKNIKVKDIKNILFKSL